MDPFDTSGLLGRRPALVVIDPQNDFLHPDGDLYCGATSEDVSRDDIVENINRLVESARAVDVPIVWSKEVHRTDGTDRGTELLWDAPTHTTESAWGEQFVDGLSVDATNLDPAEYLVEKRRYNLFHNTDLDHLLRTFRVDTLVLAGVTTSVCVHYTAQGALERDYVFRTVEEATAATTPELHAAGLACQRNIQPGGVQSIGDVRSAFENYDGNPIVQRVKSDGSLVKSPVPE